MADDRQDNIFSLAGKQKPKPKTSVPAAAPSPSKPPQGSAIGASLDYGALKQAFSKVQEMRDELERNLENVYAKTGWSKDHISKVLDNPSNYQAKGVNAEDLHLRRKTLKMELRKIIGADVVEAKELVDKEKELDKRKHKLMGSRRNWLNMR